MLTENRVNNFPSRASLNICKLPACISILIIFSLVLANAPAVRSQGFESVTQLTPFGVSKNSGERTQSKVWKHDGKWWTVFPTSSGTYIWRLDGNAWTSVLKISSSSSTKADCKPLNDVCHILLWREYNYSSMLVSVQYDPSTRNYKLWPQRPAITYLNLDAGVETATIDVDGAGRMWLASDGTSDIRVRWSDPPYQSWSQPVIVATGVTDDDIGTVIWLPALGKMGVFWSNQNTKRYGFKTHQNGTTPTAWSGDEVPASQSALNIKAGMADDHIDLAVADDGTLFCAVKTGYDTYGYPAILLLKRQPTGAWDNAYEVSDTGTKPIVIVNNATHKLKVIFPSASGSDLLYKESPLETVSFGPLRTLRSGTYDNPTSIKDNYDQDAVILATDVVGRQIVGVLGSDVPPSVPTVPELVAPANYSDDQRTTVSLGWKYSAYATAYRVQVSTRPDFSTLYLDRPNVVSNYLQVDNLSPGVTYYWRVQASNSRGASNWSAAWQFMCNPPSGVAGLVAHWKLDEGAGTSIFDQSGNGNNGTTSGFPTWTTGVSGSALAFNGLNQYATIPDKASLDVSSQITLTAWVRPEKIASQKIITKGDSKIADGYELGLLSSGKVSFRINQYSSDTCKVNSGTLYPVNGTWMHIAGTFNGKEMKIYVNGVENKRVVFTSPVSIVANNLSATLAASIDQTSVFKGAIDDVRIYNYALSGGEIYTLATTSSAKTDGTARLTVSGPADRKVDETTPDVIDIFPNPVESTLFVRLSGDAAHSLSIWDQYGRVVYRTATGETPELTIALGELGLPPGLYHLSIQSKGSVIVKQFLKK